MKLKQSFILILFGFLLIGCNNEAGAPDDNNINQFQRLSSGDRHTEVDKSNEKIASHLADIAANVPGVEQSLAIIVGPYALVGIKIDEDLDSSRVGTIKYSVTEALRSDPYGKTAVVVANPDIINRIQSIAEKVSQGHPIDAVIDEISALISRTMPQFPTRQRPVDNIENKGNNEQEQKQLEDIKREQSNEDKEG